VATVAEAEAEGFQKRYEIVFFSHFNRTKKEAIMRNYPSSSHWERLR
jgi:hypothetical protein